MRKIRRALDALRVDLGLRDHLSSCRLVADGSTIYLADSGHAVDCSATKAASSATRAASFSSGGCSGCGIPEPNHDRKVDASTDTPQINRGRDWLLQQQQLIVVQRIEMDLDEMIMDQTDGRFRESRNV